MNRYRALLPLLLIASVHAVFAQGIAAPPPPPPSSTTESMGAVRQEIVIVSGTAAIEMAPDQVSFNIGVETVGQTVRGIVDANNKKIAKIIALLKAKGVKAAEIQTSAFHLTAKERDGKHIGYEIRNEVGVTRHGVSDVGDLISAAIDAGANEVTGPEFSVQNEKSVQLRCIDESFGDAKLKASRMATLAQRQLGRVLAITDGSSSPFEMKYHSPGVEGGVLGGVAMEAGVHIVSCGVTVAFQLN